MNGVATLISTCGVLVVSLSGDVKLMGFGICLVGFGFLLHLFWHELNNKSY